MEITLKNVKHYAGMSHETESFVADVYINGIKRACANNEGRGGCTFVTPLTQKDYELVKAAKKYFESQPDIYDKELDFTYKNGLDVQVDMLIDKYLQEKELLKDMKKGILYGDNPDGYRIISWKGFTIDKLLGSAQGVTAIKKVVSDLKSKGEKIINTNIPAEILA